MQIFYFRFLMDLHVLGCPEHDLTIYTKCLSVYISVCHANFVAPLVEKLMGEIA